MNLKKNHYSRRAMALLLTLVMCVGMIPTAFAAQQNSYHDPAEHWMQATGRTNELDANSVVTRETFKCGECGKATSFEVFRVPEYTRNGQPALSRNVKYSDGTMVDGVGKGDTMDGIPGKDATYTGYHYTKAVCETCGGINTNMSKSEYGYLKNVYWLYDCAAAFTQELDETVSYEYTDDTYHTVTTKGGTYCAFCYGTNHTVNRKLERHSMVTEVLPQPANGRFATVEKCSLCDYARYDYTAAKAVIAGYYGVVDGKPHTITVSDLSEAGVRTSIRYGNSADSCTMTSAPNYTEEGQYMVYYEITYTYKGKEMTENGVAKVWLRDESTKDDGSCACGCGDPNCGCQNKHCNGNCCTDKGCGENHKYILLDSTKAGCTTLGYDRYLCTKCGKIEKRDYVDSLGHAWQSIVIRDATCEADGKQLELCSRCGEMKQTATPRGEHSYEVYTVAATCTSPGYTVRECSVCGDRHIEDITAALPHNYESHVIAATCENGGKTIHRCDGCGSSFVTDYTDALGHSWDEGTLVTNATCTGEGVMEYRCTRCGYHRLDADPADGHIPGAPATCTEPQLCTRCGAVLEKALGHDYKSEVTAPTCTEMGYTTNTCTRCGDTNKTDYQNISDALNRQNIPFSPEAPLWNKHKVKRVLENTRYIGKDGYPVMIDESDFQAVQEKISEKGVKYQAQGKVTLLDRLKPYFRCTCNGKMVRLGGHWQDSGKLYLKCECCGIAVTLDADATIQEIVRQFQAHKCQGPDAYAPSAEFIRLNNAINRGLERPDSPEAVMSLILQGAAARYDCCPQPISEYEPSDRSVKVDWHRFRRVVSYITVASDAAVSLTFTDDNFTGKDK